MRAIMSLLREGFGLIVDDQRLALAIIIWLLLAMVGLPRLAAGTHFAGLILFAGLAAILVESVLRRARH